MGDLGAGGGHAFGASAHLADDARQLLLHGTKRLQQLAGFIAARDFQGIRQVTLRNGLRELAAALHWLHDGACDQRGQRQTECDGGQCAGTKNPLAGLGYRAAALQACTQKLGHVLAQGVEGGERLVGERAQVFVHQARHIGLAATVQLANFSKPLCVGRVGGVHTGKQGFARVVRHQRVDPLHGLLDVDRRGFGAGLELVHVFAVDGLEKRLGAHPVQAQARRPALHLRLALHFHGGNALAVGSQGLDPPDAYAGGQRCNQQDETKTQAQAGANAERTQHVFKAGEKGTCNSLRAAAKQGCLSRDRVGRLLHAQKLVLELPVGWRIAEPDGHQRAEKSGVFERFSLQLALGPDA